jgi:hypothetical protein
MHSSVAPWKGGKETLPEKLRAQLGTPSTDLLNNRHSLSLFSRRLFEPTTVVDSSTKASQFALIINFALPYFEHFPSSRAKAPDIHQVTPLVAANLREPVRTIRKRLPSTISALNTAMPKTAVHKKTCSHTGEDNVRFTGQSLTM